MSAIMALLFVSIAMPGCLSMVIGREMMEGVREPPKIKNMPDSVDLSHTFVLDSNDPPLTQVTELKTAQISIDYTVESIIINFQTTMSWENLIPDEADERQVEVVLLWCDSTGANCDDDNPIWTVMADNGSYPQTRIELDRIQDRFEDGLWELTVSGRGIGWNTGVSAIDSQDSWSLRLTVIRPCYEFTDSDECIPTVDFD